MVGTRSTPRRRAQRGRSRFQDLARPEVVPGEDAEDDRLARRLEHADVIADAGRKSPVLCGIV